MKVKTRTDDTLILRGYSWIWLALAVVFFLLTPLWVMIAMEFDEWEAVIVVAIVPLFMMLVVWRDYQNWQLVLQAEYGEGALYKGRWGEQQRTNAFALDTLEEARLETETVRVRKNLWRTQPESRHHLTLKFRGWSRPVRVGIGTEGRVISMVTHINGWLSKTRYRQGQDRKSA